MSIGFTARSYRTTDRLAGVQRYHRECSIELTRLRTTALVPAAAAPSAWSALDDASAGAASAIVVSAVDRLGNESERIDVLRDALGDALNGVPQPAQ